MTSLIDRGFALLNRAMAPAAAMTVRYTRGATVISDELPATLSNQQIEQIIDGGAVIGRQFTWQLNRTYLVFDSAPTLPQRSDRIEWRNNGLVYVFEVLPEPGQPETPAVDPRMDWIPASVNLVDIHDEQ